ncbi:MAG: sigma-70 family RNA polymerase sigma factor [Flavobacteriia bacterium]|nr:sigma-70 family RNA polymerase sigma factor [Flavobacteriia bacterium]
MKCVLTQIYKSHKIWLEIVESFSVNSETAKDVVSEMYLNVQRHIETKKADIYYNGDQINYYFIYICLRNLVYDLKRKEKKVSYTEIDDEKHEQISDEYKETPDNYCKLKAIIDWYEKPEYLEMLQNDAFLENYSSDKMHVYYLRRIFKEVYLDGKKLAKFSRETKITYWSLRNTLKTIKNQIKKGYENRDDTRNDI